MVLGEQYTCKNINIVTELVISRHAIVRYYERHKNGKKELKKIKNQIDKYNFLIENYENDIKKLKTKIRVELKRIVNYFCGNCKITKDGICYIFEQYVLRTIV